MQETLAALPEYQRMKAIFSMHVDLCNKCMGEYTARNLEAAAALEQEFATGLTDSGKPSKAVLKTLLTLFDKQKLEFVSDLLRKSDALRLVMMFLISQNGITESDRQLLISHPSLALTDAEIQALTNLSMLGVRQSVAYDKSRIAVNPFAHSSRGGCRDNQFNHCRFIPACKNILGDFAAGSLDSTLFPYIEAPRGAPSTSVTAEVDSAPVLRNTKPSWATRKAAPPPTATAPAAPTFRTRGPKIILFVLGGISYSEIRSAYTVMNETSREVIIGSTDVLSPVEFLATLRMLHRTTPPSEQEIGSILEGYKRRSDSAPPPSSSSSSRRRGASGSGGSSSRPRKSSPDAASSGSRSESSRRRTSPESSSSRTRRGSPPSSSSSRRRDDRSPPRRGMVGAHSGASSASPLSSRSGSKADLYAEERRPSSSGRRSERSGMPSSSSAPSLSDRMGGLNVRDSRGQRSASSGQSRSGQSSSSRSGGRRIMERSASKEEEKKEEEGSSWSIASISKSFGW